MDKTKKNILLTGLPGVGKTTLMKKLSEELHAQHPVGFYTEEIRVGGARKGFGLISLDGKRGLLSHEEIKKRDDIQLFEVIQNNRESLLREILSHSARTLGLP